MGPAAAHQHTQLIIDVVGFSSCSRACAFSRGRSATPKKAMGRLLAITGSSYECGDGLVVVDSRRSRCHAGVPRQSAVAKVVDRDPLPTGSQRWLVNATAACWCMPGFVRTSMQVGIPTRSGCWSSCSPDRPVTIMRPWYRVG